MTEELHHLSDLELVALVDAALDALTDDRLRLPDDRDVLALTHEAVRLTGRVQAWQTALVARVEDEEVAVRAHGTSAATWLADVANLTRTEALALVRSGQEWRRFPQVAQAVHAGAMLPAQASAITHVLGQLPDDLPEATLGRAEEMMVDFARRHNAVELRRLSGRLLELVAPQIAEEAEERRLERELLRAMRSRFLSFRPDHAGSVLIRGSLPVGAAQAVTTVLDAFADQIRRGAEVLDANAEQLTPGMRRADALCAMADLLQRQGRTPVHGGDRPRVVVTCSWETLTRAATGVGPLAGRLLATDEPIAPSQLRQWLCDCEVLPVVLGGASVVLDAGRAERLVPPAMRAALEARDRGCVFPGCDAPPVACHAHHIQPWWAGGRTSLANLVLVCPHHHGIVEPSSRPEDDPTRRWQVRLPQSGPAEVIPPRHVDPTLRPRIHNRFRVVLRT
ncbi:DUF222 domain-containing protein [Propioniciclava soli]|uniref:DUF222 domain-containing protein n=1 Tax=Propioniciclava soli TaxID=2775081 RepID=A0ABZ3CAJ9_9ACTN